VNASDLLVIYKFTFFIISVKCSCVWGDLEAHVLLQRAWTLINWRSPSLGRNHWARERRALFHYGLNLKWHCIE